MVKYFGHLTNFTFESKEVFIRCKNTFFNLDERQPLIRLRDGVIEV